MRRFLALSFILLGIFCFLLGGYYFWQRTNPQRLSFNINPTSTFTQTSMSSAKPIEIIIPDLNIDLPIYPATIEKGKWEATTKGVSYLTSSPAPGDQGNSILYGHNWQNLLGKLTRAKTGQEIQIKFDDNTARIFIITSASVVSPQQVSVLEQTQDRRITLYTCTGFFDQKRFVVAALLKED